MNQAAFAATLLDARQPCPPGLRAWNGSDPGVRLAVYRNNVVASLIDALADTFAVVRELVGDAFFRAMASDFVRAQPPRSCVLAHYGSGFPAFVEGFRPARQVAYLADVAHLEWARVLAFHAADAAPLAGWEVMAALTAVGDAGSLRFACHPSLAVVASRFAIVSIWAAHQQEDAGAALAEVNVHAAESALVVRRQLDVLVLRLPPGAARFITALQAGESLASAAGLALQVAAGFDPTTALALLARHDALTAVRTPTENRP